MPTTTNISTPPRHASLAYAVAIPTADGRRSEWMAGDKKDVFLTTCPRRAADVAKGASGVAVRVSVRVEEFVAAVAERALAEAKS